MGYLQKIQQEWETEIQPIIKHVCQCISTLSTKQQDMSIRPNQLFLYADAMEVYTKIYQLTTHPHVDFIHLDFLYKKEMGTISYFCSQFHILSLEDIPLQQKGIQLLIQWFHCFFHHLNRLREKVYHNHQKVEQDIKRVIQKSYLSRQKPTISKCFVEKWTHIRKDNYSHDMMVAQVMNILFSMDPAYYREVIKSYFQQFQLYLEKKSYEWNHPSLMEKIRYCFQQEKKMFVFYFSNHTEQDIDQHEKLLKKILVYPYYERFLYDEHYGWKAMMKQPTCFSLSTTYFFYSQLQDPTLWVLCHQEFLEESIHSFPEHQMVILLSQLLKTQDELVQSIFSSEKLKSCFHTIVEKSILDIFIEKPILVSLLVKQIHFMIQKPTRTVLLEDVSALIPYCPDKDVFYEHYQQAMKERLWMERYHPSHENFLLKTMQEKLGMSFVLNLKLMLKELESNCLSDHPFHVYQLSKIVWEKRSPPLLQYRLPFLVQEKLKSLVDAWKTDPLRRCENRWLQGSVSLGFQKTTYIMTPIQAIVLLALEVPSTYLELIEKLQIPDDPLHNLEGVLESLFKVQLVQQEKEKWCWNTTTIHGTKIHVPSVKPKKKNHHVRKEEDVHHPMVMEAWTVRKMKQQKTCLLSMLVQDLQQQFPKNNSKTFKTLIDNLVERDFLQKENSSISYVP